MTASLPYAGTSGYSGSEASRERAEFVDTTGRTGELQLILAAYVYATGERGTTIHDVRLAFPDHHHGTLSGCLTVLHKAGRISRLTEKRDHCSVYVAPQFVGDREQVEPKRKSRLKEVVLSPEMDAEYIGHLVIAALNDTEKITVRAVA